HPFDRMNKFLVGMLDLTAEIRDVYVDNVCVVVVIDTPYGIDNLYTGPYSIPILKQIDQQLVFLRGQIQLLSIQPYGMRIDMDHKPSARVSLRCVEATELGTPHQCIDAGKQFFEVKRLNQVIVGTGIESMHFIVRFPQGT